MFPSYIIIIIIIISIYFIFTILLLLLFYKALLEWHFYNYNKIRTNDVQQKIETI